MPGVTRGVCVLTNPKAKPHACFRRRDQYCVYRSKSNPLICGVKTARCAFRGDLVSCKNCERQACYPGCVDFQNWEPDFTKMKKGADQDG